MLPNFKIQKFRTFSDLEIEKLGRVNLIVGKNNAGKTSLLEALRIFGSEAAPMWITSTLTSHDEVNLQMGMDNGKHAELRIESLFHGEVLPDPGAEGIVLGPMGERDRSVRISIGRVRPSPIRDEPAEIIEPPAAEGVLGLVLASAGSPPKAFDLRTVRAWARLDFSVVFPAWPVLVPAGGFSRGELSRWWERLIFFDTEDRVIERLSVVEPVKRVYVMDNPLGEGQRRIIVRLQNRKEAVPLRSLGDGMCRIFEIALGLEAARAPQPIRLPLPGAQHISMERVAGRGMLLIDELENGIHYSALPKVWKFLLLTAREYDLQIFATCHSWDCIEGLQAAVAEDAAADATLIRLERTAGGHTAIVMPQEELELIARERIEVR
jgi:AAA domain, putative AbiEii toxin, Type IV TA system/AAA ATPase domain